MLKFKIVVGEGKMEAASAELTKIGIEFSQKRNKLFITAKSDDEILTVLNLDV